MLPLVGDGDTGGPPGPDAELYVAPNRDHFTGLGALRIPLTDFLVRQITRVDG